MMPGGGAALELEVVARVAEGGKRTGREPDNSKSRGRRPRRGETRRKEDGDEDEDEDESMLSNRTKSGEKAVAEQDTAQQTGQNRAEQGKVAAAALCLALSRLSHFSSLLPSVQVRAGLDLTGVQRPAPCCHPNRCRVTKALPDQLML